MDTPTPTPTLTPAQRISTALTDFNDLWHRPVRRLDAWKTNLTRVQAVLREVVTQVDRMHIGLLVVQLADAAGLPPSVVVTFARAKPSGHPPAAPGDPTRAGWSEEGATLAFTLDFETGLVRVERTPFRGLSRGSREFDHVISLAPEQVEEAAPLLLVDFVSWAIKSLPGARPPTDLQSWRLQHNL